MSAGWGEDSATWRDAVQAVRGAALFVAEIIGMAIAAAVVFIAFVVIVRATAAVLGYGDPLAPRSPASTTTVGPK